MKRTTKLIVAAIIYILIGCVFYMSMHSGNPSINDLPIELFIFMFIFAGANSLISIFQASAIFDDS
jgi:hypothetical protein